MRVLFINTFEKRGGAAIVAGRLQYVLEAQHHAECFSCVAYKSTDNPRTLPTRGKTGALVEKVIDRVFNKVGLQYQFFPFSSASIRAEVRALKPDVISLHNTHGGYFETSLLRDISKTAPVVWTLHDMWSISGNAAHTFSDESWKSLQNPAHLTHIYPAIGINTGAWLLRQKKKIYHDAALTVVTPSRWLQSLARQSPVFEGKEVLQINNGVDTQLFGGSGKNEGRQLLGIPPEAKVIMFSADFLLGNPWKGGDDLLQVLTKINDLSKDKVHLIMAGDGEIHWADHLDKFIVHKTGYIRDMRTMAQYLAASDIFLYPTRADNLPNVLVEAIAAGTPCVTVAVGGCPEIIRDGENGRVLVPGDLAGMAQAAVALLRDDTTHAVFSTNCRAVAQAEFSLQGMGQQYIDLFHRVAK